MILNIQALIKDFFERNLFERIIIYILISYVLTSFIFVFLFGERSFDQSQNRQWVFYGLLALDYLFSFRKILNIKITINPMSILAGIFCVMILHGLFIGIMNGNAPFIILNDTIPIAMHALNILRMQSFEEIKKPISIRFILISCIVTSGLNIAFTFMSGLPNIGNVAIFYPALLASLFLLRPFPLWVLPFAAIMIALTVGDLNRTSMLFIALIIAGYIGYTSLIEPVKAVLLTAMAVIICMTTWTLIPEDSKTYARIMGLTQIDLSARTGSIGERQQEQEQVQIKLEKTGTSAELFGLGFGGLYEAKFTHQYMKDYGHAHYAWVWFNLRFGAVGYFYMVIFIGMLFYNFIRCLTIGTSVSIFIALLCLSSLIYVFTFVNAVWLLSGLTFIYLRPELEKKLAQQYIEDISIKT